MLDKSKEVKEASFRCKVNKAVLELCTQGSYELISDFTWLVKQVLLPIAGIVEEF